MDTFHNTREISATVEQVFAAFSDPKRLARWWGPAGFTNTFEVCEFIPGGRWVFVMHGPDGKDYFNECEFVEIDEPGRVVIDHRCEPLFRLTITLAASVAGTQVTWTQIFENEKFAQQMQAFLETANGQNLDRLTEEVKRVGE